MQEIKMRAGLIIAAALLLSCEVAFAQTTTGMPNMPGTPALGSLGSTSPLSTIGTFSPIGNSPTGLPLGATGIYTGGLSPAPFPDCAAGASTSSGLGGTASDGSSMMTGTNSTIGGSAGSSMLTGTNSTLGASAGSSMMTGTSSTVGAAPTSGCPSSATVSPTGTASPLSIPGTTSSTLNGGTIPLGATQLNGGGVSPLVTVPPPQ
jgi:hypothetical protein